MPKNSFFGIFSAEPQAIPMKFCTRVVTKKRHSLEKFGGSAVGRCHGNPERVSFFVSISRTLSTSVYAVVGHLLLFSQIYCSFLPFKTFERLSNIARKLLYNYDDYLHSIGHNYRN